MEVEIHLLIVSIVLFIIAMFLAIDKQWPLVIRFDYNRLKQRKSKMERRAHARYQTSLQAMYNTISEDGKVWIRDISKGGARLFLHNPIRIGSLLRLEINLPNESKPVVTHGWIVWANEHEAGFNSSEVDQGEIMRVLRYIAYRKQMTSINKEL